MLFPHEVQRERRRPANRTERMAERLDARAGAADREVRACARSGDQVGRRRARQEAADARRAAAMLRAGPRGVASVLDAS